MMIAASERAAAGRGQDRQLATLERLLAIEATDLKSALDEASQLVSEALNADKVDAMLHEAATETLVAVGTSHTPMGQRQHEIGMDRLPIANGGREVEVFQSGKPYITGRADEDPGQLRGVTDGLGVRSAMITPLEVAGERRGVLLASSATFDFFVDDDVSFLQAVARWVGMVAHRAELVERESAEAAERGRQIAARELVTVLAHDLRNHLTPLVTRLDLLRRRARREDRALDLRDAEAATEALDRFRRLIVDLLDVSRLERGLFALDLQPVNLADLVRETAAAFVTDTTGVSVEAPDEVIVAVDPDRLRQALENVLANAMRYSPPGAPVNVVVERDDGRDGRWTVVEVSDHGPGIPPALLPHLFTRFGRGPDSTGLGLGLYLASQITAAHGGRLSAASPPGQGAVFRFALPLEDRGGDKEAGRGA